MLITNRELEQVLRYPRGRCLRLARANLIPHVKLPDGEIRFDVDAVSVAVHVNVRALLEAEAQRPGKAVAHG